VVGVVSGRLWLLDKLNSTFLKGQCHEIFDFRFFHESVSPKPLRLPLGPFNIFLSKISRDICSSRCTTGVF
jgi:hypothetical protein